MCVYLWVSNPMLNAVISFHFNQSDIIERLCEGRFFEENKCQGMCYLNKQVHSQDEVPFQEFAQFELESHQIIDRLQVYLSDPAHINSPRSLLVHPHQVYLSLVLPPPQV
jgi:hypothetical protein